MIGITIAKETPISAYDTYLKFPTDTLNTRVHKNAIIPIKKPYSKNPAELSFIPWKKSCLKKSGSSHNNLLNIFNTPASPKNKNMMQGM